MYADTASEYASIIHEAQDFSAWAQRSPTPTGVDAGIVERLGDKARDLGERLRAILPDLNASSCTVEVSFPPAIAVSVTWGRSLES